ncbi:hypothetical protein Mapa_014287 [Marchantia paleacea]|nr:hypothetical protein Mapa_014287 [Marchantia paleacea]
MENRHISNEFRLALALAIVKGRGRSNVVEQDAHWKKKAKMYKQEIKSLTQQVQEMEDHATLEKLPALAPCDCLFLSGGLRRLQTIEIENTSVGDKNTNKLSVQLFLSNVRRLNRAKQKKRAGSSTDFEDQAIFSIYSSLCEIH